MSFGVTTAGFVAPSLDDIKTSLENDLKAIFGAQIDLDPQSNFGQLVGVLAERFFDLWQLGAGLDAAFNPDAAKGIFLVNLAALTGTIEIPASPSTVELTLMGTASTVVPKASVASVLNATARFETLADATLAAATAWQALTAYSLGDRVKNSTNPVRIYLNVGAGTSAASGGPVSTSSSIADAGATWRYLGDGSAFVDVAAECSVTGPVQGSSGTITAIQTPVSGWASVTNILDAVLGADLETDADLRLRREAELRATGNAALDAMRGDLLEVTGVTAATVFQNVGDTTNTDGVPPHAVECLVQGGADQDIRDAIFASVAAGIATHGGVTGTSTDAEGVSHEIDFSRPTAVPIYIIVNLIADASLWPADGVTQVQNAIILWSLLQGTGKDAVSAAINANAFKVTGTLDSTALIGTAPSPGSTATVPINTRQLATYDTGRIAVNVTFGTP